MNVDTNEYRSCRRKKAYESRADVISPVQYLCRFCGKWHGASFGFEKFGEFNDGANHKLKRSNRFARRKLKRKESKHGRDNDSQ